LNRSISPPKHDFPPILTVVFLGYNTILKKYNFEVMNEMLEKLDTGLGDCGFSCFTRSGTDKHLLTSDVVTRAAKPANESYPPILRALADELSQERNFVEQDFSWLLQQRKTEQ